MPPTADYYRILQVDPSADPDVIQAAYRRLASRLHPDAAGRSDGTPDAERMAALNAAYAVLSDPAQRSRYDASMGLSARLPAAPAAQRSPSQPPAGTRQEIRPMPYSAEISRANPTLFVFLLDQSGSMSDPFGGVQSNAQSGAGGVASKAAGVADAVNRMLSNLVIRCSQGEVTRRYFEVAVLGYGAQRGQVAPALGGALAGREVVSIADIGDAPARIEDRLVRQPDGAGGIIEATVKFPIWFEPVAGSDTPMVEALRRATSLVERWVASHRSAFPPVVVHLTDGEATDGDPIPAAQRLMSLETDDGAVLLFNCHLSSRQAPPLLFPDSGSHLPDAFARTLFQMSSRLTPTMLDYARRQGYVLGDGARGFVFQADLVDVIRFLDIGTRPGELR
jgi:hypothetical protein